MADAYLFELSGDAVEAVAGLVTQWCEFVQIWLAMIENEEPGLRMRQARA
ncbi:MAG: hypothetical protein IIV41_01085 [Akkermansia sp.]|nr:hypothetical protein [Akkermansia sp.]